MKNSSDSGPWHGQNSDSRGGRSQRGCGRGGRNKPVCQVCGKSGHTTAICYFKYDQSYMGSVPGSLASNSNHNNSGNGSSGSQSYHPAYLAIANILADPNWYMDSGASVTSLIIQQIWIKQHARMVRKTSLWVMEKT